MKQPKLDENGNFLVRESKTINFIAGGVMLTVFFVSMTFGDYGWGNYLLALCVFLIPGAIALAKGKRNAVIIIINHTGFYYAGKLVTDWSRFYDAVVQDKREPGSYKDNFVLDIRFYSSDHSLLYTKSIPLTNNQDKAEEEVIEAINFFYKANVALPSVDATW
jgi:hypothetical protein